MTGRDLTTRLAEADPYPRDVPLPDPRTARPDVSEIVARGATHHRRRWRQHLPAAAAGLIAVVAAGVLFFVQPGGEEPNERAAAATTTPDSGPAIGLPAPADGSTATTFRVEPAGTGPPLVWEEVEAPGNGVVEVVIHSAGRYYLSDYHPAGNPEEFAGSWFASLDGRSWTRIPESENFPSRPRGGIVAVGETLVAFTFPEVVTFDTAEGSVVVDRLDLAPLAAIPDACFGLGLRGGPPDTEPLHQACGEAEAIAVAGPRGVLVVAEPRSVPISEACPPTGDQPEPDLDAVVAGGRVVAEGCYRDEQGYPVHPLAWFSPDGTDWTSLPGTGPFAPGFETEIRDVVGTSEGFALLRGTPADESEQPPQVWVSTDGLAWMQLDAPAGFDAFELVSWDGRAIATSSDGWWSDASVSVQPLWEISPTGITVLKSEPLPELPGSGSVAAGPAGIVVTVAVDVADEDSLESSWEFVLEFSTDGLRWSRQTVSEDLYAGDFIVGETEVVRPGSYRLGSTPLFIGTPDSS